MNLFKLSIISIMFFTAPEFSIYDRVRPSETDDILGDIKSHLHNNYYDVTIKDYPTGSIVSQDSLNISTVHESTHGINSFLRNKYSTNENKVNAFYCLNNQYIVIKESNLALKGVGKNIPKSIRFTSYDLCFNSKISESWNDRCLYLCDEFLSHGNATMYRKQKKIKERDSAIKFAFEYGMYSLVHLQMLKGTGYEDYDKLKWFHEWNFNRCFDTFDGERGLIDNMKIFIKSEDCKDLRLFIAQEFGQEFYERFYKIGNMN